MTSGTLRQFVSVGVTTHLGWSTQTTTTDAAPPFTRRHEAECTCGWRGPSRRDLEMARSDGQEHSETDRRAAPRPRDHSARTVLAQPR